MSTLILPRQPFFFRRTPVRRLASHEPGQRLAQRVKSKHEPAPTARRRDAEDDAQEKNKVCYAIYISGRNGSLALQEARAVLGAKAPRSWGVLSIRASRWAKKNGLSMERKR